MHEEPKDDQQDRSDDQATEEEDHEPKQRSHPQILDWYFGPITVLSSFEQLAPVAIPSLWQDCEGWEVAPWGR